MTIWPTAATAAVRRETHFGNRVVRCYADRPRGADRLLAEAAARAPDAEALVDGDLRLTYGELHRRVDAVAGNLAAAGLERGDRLALYLENRAQAVLAFLAGVRLGAVAVPLGARYRARELAHALALTRPKVLVHEAALAEFLPRDGLPRRRFAVAGDAHGAAPFAALETTATAPAGAPAEDDAVAIMFTSGTTGLPKGAVWTHLGLVHSVLQFERCWRLGPGERTILAAPWSHAIGIGAVIMTMARVAGCVVVQRRFQAAEFLRLAAAEGLTYAALAPAMYHLCVRDPAFAGADLRHWRVGGFGGAPMPEALIAELAAALPGLTLVNAYGATETTAPPVLMPLGHTAAHAGSVGRVVPCGELLVMDEDGREAPPGAPGEIWFRGPTVVPGYWRGEGAESFVGGWWRSGDIGTVDGDGYVRVLDRQKDMLIRGGLKVFSAEVEAALADHPDITECAIVGRPDPVLGERVHAVVVSPAGGPDLAALRAWCAGRLADYKIPESAEVRAEPLPRNASGKVQKNLLRAALDGPGHS